MIEIDGSGGGQMLRSALTLAVVTDERVRVRNVRGDRPTPGLRPQHLAALRVLCRLTDGDASGATVGAEEIGFAPRTPPGGALTIDVGTAGSVPLLFEALVPLAPVLEAPLRVRATGGTDVKWAPTSAYLEGVKLATLRRFGLEGRLDVHRHGFYPAGGGAATLALEPGPFDRIELVERGEFTGLALTSIASESLADRDVAERQRDGLLEAIDRPLDADDIRYVETNSPGTAVTLVARHVIARAGFGGVGERGVPAETIGRRVGEAYRAFDAGPGAVDRHLGDQLMVPLALAGGAVWVPTVTDHMRTNATVIEAFGGALSIEPADEGAMIVVDAALA